MNKIASKLSMITGMNALAFNALQGVNNVVLGNTLFLAESLSGHIVDKKNWFFAQKTFWENGAGIGDLNKFNAVTKMGQLSDIFDPLQGDFIDNFGKNVTGPFVKKAFQRDALFFLQRGGEFQMQTQTMLAVLDATTVKDKDGNLIKNKDGSNMTLYQAYEKNQKNELVLNEKVATIQMNRSPNEDLTINDVRAIIHGLNGKMHGKYNTFDRTALQRQWYGQLLMLFRGWMVPGIRRRWGFSFNEQQVDYETGMLTEGMYISFIRLIKESLSEKRNIVSVYKYMTPTEKANIVKTVSELAVFLSMWILVRALQSMDIDDDDEEIYFLLYQMRRLQTDIGFYFSPTEPFKILKSPSATLTMFSKVMKLVDQLGRPFELYERDSGLNEKGDSKFVAKFVKLFGASPSKMDLGENIKALNMMQNK